MPIITCYPAKRNIKIDYDYHPNYYDVSEIINFNCPDDTMNCLENYGYPILWGDTRISLDQLEMLWIKYNPDWRSVHLTYDGKSAWGTIYSIMVPPEFKIGDPIYFNTDTGKVGFAV